jgi:hypothetical protein
VCGERRAPNWFLLAAGAGAEHGTAVAVGGGADG